MNFAVSSDLNGSILLLPPAAGASPRLFFTPVKICSDLVLPSVLKDPVFQVAPIPCPNVPVLPVLLSLCHLNREFLTHGS